MIRIPEGVVAAELVLRGQRLAGSDNDSYFDDLFMGLTAGDELCEPPPQAPDAGVTDMGMTDDMGGMPDAGLMGDMDAPDAQLSPDMTATEDFGSSDGGGMADPMGSSSAESTADGCDGCSSQGRFIDGPIFVALVLLGLLRRRSRSAHQISGR